MALLQPECHLSPAWPFCEAGGQHFSLQGYSRASTAALPPALAWRCPARPPALCLGVPAAGSLTSGVPEVLVKGRARTTPPPWCWRRACMLGKRGHLNTQDKCLKEKWKWPFCRASVGLVCSSASLLCSPGTEWGEAGLGGPCAGHGAVDVCLRQVAAWPRWVSSSTSLESGSHFLGVFW